MHTIGFVVFPNFYMIGFAAVTVFELANLVLDEPAYEVTVLSEAGGLVSASAGIRIDSEPFGEAVFDMVMFASAIRRVGKESRVPPETPDDGCPDASSQTPDA
jgi:transcriptional regulator GlxA family with amidase domain